MDTNNTRESNCCVSECLLFGEWCVIEYQKSSRLRDVNDLELHSHMRALSRADKRDPKKFTESNGQTAWDGLFCTMRISAADYVPCQNLFPLRPSCVDNHLHFSSRRACPRTQSRHIVQIPPNATATPRDKPCDLVVWISFDFVAFIVKKQEYLHNVARESNMRVVLVIVCSDVAPRY